MMAHSAGMAAQRIVGGAPAAPAVDQPSDSGRRRLLSGWILLCLAFCVLTGIICRFTELQHRTYWFDEACTSQRVFGHSNAEVERRFFDGRPLTAGEFQQTQRKDGKHGLVDTVLADAEVDPKHPPLYFVLARLWADIAGDSIAAMRSLPALFSVLALPCAYWLAMELFGSTAAAWSMVAIAAVSPFHVMYAQESRQYSLWLVGILASSAALLRAMRVQSRRSWGLYALTLTMAIYTHLLTLLVAVSHAAYVAATERCRWNWATAGYLAASAVAALLFLPWALVILANTTPTLTTYLEWTTTNIGWSRWAGMWVVNLGRLFVASPAPLPAGVGTALHWAVIAVEAAAFWYLTKTAQRRTWLFVVLLAGVTAVALSAPDLVSGGKRATVGRFETPCFVGIELAVAYLVSQALRSGADQARAVLPLVSVALLAAGIISCLFIVHADDWNRHGARETRAAAAIINGTEGALLVGERLCSQPGDLMVLSHYLRPDVKMRLVVEPNLPVIPDDSAQVFLLDPRQRLRQGLQSRGYTFVPLDSEKSLWKLVR